MSDNSVLRFLRRQTGALKADIRKFVEDRPLRDPAAWAKAHPFVPPDAEVRVRFMIPLVSPEKARDWPTVCANLARTIGSLRRQTSGNWTATVCCQRCPEGVDFDEQLRFLPYPVPADPRGNDKPRKQRHLIRHIARADRSDGYLFFLDADDLMHPRVVEHIVTDNNGHGYTITQGYMVDLLARRAVALGIPGESLPEEQRPFYRLCGSSSALRFDLRRDRACTGPAFKRGAHGNIRGNVAKFGLILEEVPFPAALYAFNHGDNLQAHRGVEGDKLALLERAPVTGEAFARLMAEFGVPEEIWRR